jgi:hypothetical protein
MFHLLVGILHHLLLLDVIAIGVLHHIGVLVVVLGVMDLPVVIVLLWETVEVTLILLWIVVLVVLVVVIVGVVALNFIHFLRNFFPVNNKLIEILQTLN